MGANRDGLMGELMSASAPWLLRIRSLYHQDGRSGHRPEDPGSRRSKARVSGPPGAGTGRGSGQVGSDESSGVVFRHGLVSWWRHELAAGNFLCTHVIRDLRQVRMTDEHSHTNGALHVI